MTVDFEVILIPLTHTDQCYKQLHYYLPYIGPVPCASVLRPSCFFPAADNGCQKCASRSCHGGFHTRAHDLGTKNSYLQKQLGLCTSDHLPIHST